MALVLKWGARKAALVDDPDPDSLRIAQVAAFVRDATLREAADRCNRLDVVLPSCSAPVRRAADKCRDAILSLVGTAPKPTASAPVSEANEEAARAD